MNLRIAVGEIVRRFEDLRLATDDEIPFHSAYSRAPLTVPIAFTPGSRERRARRSIGTRHDDGGPMETSPSAASPLSDEWCAHHFNYLAPEFAREIHPTLARMRAQCPVTHSDERGGFWVVTRYEDVLHVAQDWETFSSELGVAIPDTKMVVPAIPEHVDPPLHRVYKRLISAWFTPAVVGPYEQPTRALVTRLIDEFIEAGTCDFMADFAQPFPGLAFFDLVLNAPADQVMEVNRPGTAGVGADQPRQPRVLGGAERLDHRVRRSTAGPSRPGATSSTPSWPPTSTAGRSPRPRSSGSSCC